MDSFKYLGVQIDNNKNNQQEKIISTSNSKVKVLALQTDEELMIYEEILKLLRIS